MARIAGVDLPKNKRMEIALTYIYGIGYTRANEILAGTEIDGDKRAKDLTDEEVSKIAKFINEHYKVEGELRTEVDRSIKRLIEIGSYRGYRHRNGLPVRGQKTHSNGRTRKGSRSSKIRKKS